MEGEIRMNGTKKVYMFLADGFEEIEGLMVVDLMRRAGINITTVSITADREIAGSHGINVMADSVMADMDFSDAEMIVLPGGMPGTKNLAKCEPLKKILCGHYNNEGKLAAICAAPTILSSLGMLKGKKATCYPSMLSELDCSEALEDSVVVDGNITTSRGLGTALKFALALISQLISEEKAAEIAVQVVA